MDAATTLMKLPTQVQDDLVALEKRIGLVTTQSKHLFAGTALTGVATAVAYGVGYWYAPSIALSSVHVPAELLAFFSDATGSTNAIGSPFENVASQLADFASGSLFKVISIASLVSGIGIGIVRQSLPAVISGVVFATTPIVIDSFSKSVIGEPTESDRAAFIVMAKSANFEGMQNMMKGKVPDSLQNYVLSQAILVQSKSSNKKPDQTALASVAARVRAVDEAVPNGLPKSISGETLYVLEKTAFGAAKTKPAQAYYADASATSELATKIGRGISVPMLISLLAGAGLLLISQRMRARVARIRTLL